MNLLRGQTNAREDTSKSSINNQDQEVEEQVEDVVVDGGAEADAHHNIKFETYIKPFNDIIKIILFQ